MSRGPAEDAELALLLEVAGTPKPGNVDRRRDAAGLRFEHFLAGAVGARPGLEEAASGAAVGDTLETAVAGMSDQRGGNTQFGCLLLLVPLVRTASHGELSPARAKQTCRRTTVEDAIGFYRAFEHVDVRVADPPEGWDSLDVRRGAAAAPALRDRGLTLWDVMQRSAERDANAREWVSGFERTFRAAETLRTLAGPIQDRTARVFLELLAEEPDTLVAIEHGPSTAAEISERAARIDSLDDADTWADELVERGINPGTTADITAAALFVALRRGLEV